MLRHIGILVDDLQSMKKWYKYNFDMEVLSEVIENKDWILKILKTATQVQTCKLKNNFITIELLKFESHKKFAHHRIDNQGYTHIAITVDNIEKYTSDYYINPEKTCKVAFIQDPENNYIELVEDIKTKKKGKSK